MTSLALTKPITTKLLPRSKNPLPGSEIAEARNLVRRCAEPRPAGDSVKAAIMRAARRLKFGVNRTKDLWYGNASRIDAYEIDRLRACASSTEIDQAVIGLEVLRQRLVNVPSPVAHQVVDGIDAALRLLGHDPTDEIIYLGDWNART